MVEINSEEQNKVKRKKITKDSLRDLWDLNLRPETIKLLEENIGRTRNDINQSKILYEPPPRIMKIKTKVNNFQAFAQQGKL